MRRTGTLVLVTLFVFVGCGERPTADPIEAVTLAAERTSEVESARMSMRMVMDGPAGAFTMTADGAFELAANRGHMTMKMDSSQLPAGAPAIGDIEAVFEGLVIYIKYPQAIAQQLPGGKPWARMDMQELGKSQGLDFASMSQLGGGDPTQYLEYLRGASGDVETVGDEEVRGVATTHYRADIDMDKVLANAPSDVRKAARASVEMLKAQIGEAPFPMDVWIDEEGLARRVSYEMKLASGPAAGTITSITLELFDFGVDVTVDIPPRSQVFDMTDFFERAASARASTKVRQTVP